MLLGIDASQANRKVRSGTEWYAFYLIREFKKLLRDRRDLSVRLYFRDAPREDLLADLPSNFEIRILHWPLKYFWGQIRLSWEMLFYPPDILFCPAHTIPMIHPKKTFTTLHDIGFEDNPELYDKLSLWYHHWSAKFAVEHAAHIFTVSEFSRQRIIEVYSCPSDRISVTNLGIAIKSTVVENVAIWKKYGLEEKDYILFLGRLEPKKNILETVKAFERLVSRGDAPQFLVLAGRKVNAGAVEDYLGAKPDLRAKVKFLGYVREEDKPALYAGAAVFLFPTLYEGFGLPILEAQAAGTPVVTSNLTSNPEVAGKGALLVDPRDAADIAAAAEKLLLDETLRLEMVRRGFANVKRFDWERVAKLTLTRMGIID